MDKRKKKPSKIPAGSLSSGRVSQTVPPAAVEAALEGLEAMAEYRRKDESELIIPEKNITTELGAGSAVAARRAYYLYWLLPDPGNARGALLSVDRFSAKIVNEGAFDVNLVMQQPHGHEVSPQSIAAWVLLANKTLKAGHTLYQDVVPVDNNLVVPLRCDIGGADCINFLAVSAARQAIGGGVTVVPAEEVGLRITVTASYKASGNVLQGGKFFALRTVDTDAGMFRIEGKPPTPIPVSDVAPGAASMAFASFDFKGKEYITPVLRLKGGRPVEASTWTAVSVKHIYRLPIPVWGVDPQKGYSRQGLYMRGDLANNWVITKTPFGAIEEAVVTGKGDQYAPKAVDLPVLSGDALLVPIDNQNFKKVVVSGKRIAGRLVQASVHPSGALRMEVGSFRDDFLSAVTFIVGVIKVAAAVAGAVGLLEKNVLSDLGDPADPHTYEVLG